jgi:L-amino acid N-acyltransferase YncA
MCQVIYPPYPQLVGLRRATVRPAKPSDAETIAVIFNQGIEDRVTTFETGHADAGQRERRIASGDELAHSR